MRPKCPIFPVAVLAVLVACGVSARGGDIVSLDGGDPLPVVPLESRWRVSAGYLYRDLGDVRFRSGSRSAGVVLPNFFGGNRQSVPAIGARGALADRSYADGFVNIDISDSTDGLTWFWAYEGAAQAGGDSIRFFHPGGRAREVSSYRQVDAPGSFGDPVEEGGPYVQLEYMMETGSALSWGPQLGFSFIRLDTSGTRSDFAAGESFVDFDVAYRDRYDLGGVTVPMAPYEGTFDGPGVLIPNIPADRSATRAVSETGRIDFFNRVQESLDLELYTFSPGMSVELRHKALYVNAAAGLAVNVVNWGAENHETLYVTRDHGKARVAREWRDRDTGTDVLFGAYAQATVGAQLTGQVGVSAFARYDWNDDLQGSVGPSRFNVDLSGVSAGAMVTFRW